LDFFGHPVLGFCERTSLRIYIFLSRKFLPQLRKKKKKKYQTSKNLQKFFFSIQI